MEIEFDPGKNASNRRKHGLSLDAAVGLAWDEAYAWPDERFDYEECRMSALVPMGDRLYYVAYVDRGDIRRIIGLRTANRKEIEKYARNA
jgi:uncharacterized DUF497 family protein